MFLLFSVLLGSSPISAVFAVSSDPSPHTAQITSMPMTSMMADGINSIDNVNTNSYPNNAISPGGGSTVPITSGVDSRNQFPNPNNISSDGSTLTNNNQLLEESTSLNSGISPNSNNISADGGALTNSNQPLEESTSLNSITPSARDANTNQVLDKESQLRAKLQDLIKGDQDCNDLYDDTIITWENIVQRTKDIVDNFNLDDESTTATFDLPSVDLPPVGVPLPRPPVGTDGTGETVVTDALSKSLDITKNTNIDKRDHTIVGTDDKDYIVGSEEDDLICALDGNDVIFSDAGVDAIFAQGGMDTVQGGIGNNQIFGGDDGDTLVGGIDDDLIAGRAGDDRLFGAEGNDVLEGDKGGDFFNCGDGIDIVLDFNPAEGDIITIDCETS
jgi:Ca2+-binding RTX toxin-like protein